MRIEPTTPEQDRERWVIAGQTGYWTYEPIEGYDYICDRCGAIHKKTEGIKQFEEFIYFDLFNKRNKKPEINDFCEICAKAVLPLFYALRDIDELMLFNYRLRKAIDEKRKQRTKDDWATSPNACNSGKGRAERRLGH